MTPEELDIFLQTPTEHERLYQQGWENPDYARGMIEVTVNGRRQLLLNSHLSVRQIALKVGYENTSFFYKKFQEDTGCTPADYRNRPHS